MIGIYAIADVKPGCREPFLEAARSLINHSRAEAGNVSYYLTREDENVYVFMEIWRSEEALQEHMESPSFLSAGKKMAYLLTEPLSIHKLDVIY